MTRPFRSLFVLSGATLAAAAALAQSTGVQLYGTIDVAVGELASQPPGPPNAAITKIKGVHNGGVQTSYFGVRGTEDLGGGLKAKFQLESFIRVDTGLPGRFNTPTVNDPFWSRSAWVALEGGFGEVRLGLNSNPAWLSMIFSSAMGANSTFSPVFRQQYNGSTRGSLGLDTALPNSISYSTPRLGGVVGTVAVQAGEGRGNGANWVGNVVYRSGPLMLTAGGARAEHEPPPDPAAAQDQQWFVIGGSYDLKVVKLFAQVTSFDNGASGLKINTPHIGLTAPLGAGELQLAWAEGRNSGSSTAKRTTTSAGYYYNLSRRTGIYGMFASDKVAVGTANSYVLGVRHAF